MSEPITRRSWFGLTALALGVSLVVVDTTIVNVITPSIIADLKIDSTAAQWVQESYAIVFAAVLLLVGRIADILGARRVFVAGVVVFAAASVLAGLAPTGAVLIGARFVQGVGGAMMLPTSLALLNQTFSGRARGQAFAVWGSTIGAATAVGPVLGGWLAEIASWRWAFGINPPIAAAIAVLSLVFLDRSPRRPGTVDVLGAVLSVIGLGALAFGLIEGRTYGWFTVDRPLAIGSFRWEDGLSPAFVALVVAAVVLAAFVARQIAGTRARRRRAGRVDPLMNTDLFRIASFRNGNIATVIIGLGEFGIIAVIPLWLQFTLGYTSLQAGLALLPLAIGSFVASGLSFSLSARLSALALVRIGLALEAVALGGLAAVAAYTDASWWLIAVALLVYGVGVGFATAQVTNVVLAQVPEQEAGQGSGIQSTFRQLGSALGIAALTTVFFAVVQQHVQDALTASRLPAEQAAQLAKAVSDSAGAVIGRLAGNPATAGAAAAGRDALAQGVAVGSLLAAGFLVLGVVATLLIPSQRADATRSADEDVAERVSG